MQEKIAIDVVLLLPENINNICKELNKGSNKKDYVSFEDGYNPHITLGMGSILVKDIDEFKKELRSLVEKSEIPEIKLTSLDIGKYVYLNPEMNDQLQKLHNNIFDLISKYNAGTVIRENFFEMSEPGSLINWVNNFPQNSAYKNYHPHVTLGIDTRDVPLEFPIVFKPTSVGFFHLGVHGTCKKLLESFNFK